jgi:hypothetical protein
MINHFNPKSRRSRGQRYHKDACGNNRLHTNLFTYIVNQGREPHYSESITIERTNEISIYHPFLKSSIHVMEVEVLVGI